MNIYFAASIRGGRNDVEIYSQIIQYLKSLGTVLTEHIGSDTLSSKGEGLSDQEIYDRDMKWLNSSDVVIAEVTQASLGVGFELGRVVHTKPILALFRANNGTKLSAMISGCSDISVARYEDIAGAKIAIREFLNNLQ